MTESDRRGTTRTQTGPVPEASPPTNVSPADLPGRSWVDVVKSVVRESLDDQVPDRAAAMTYYAVLSMFPAAIVLASLFGLVADPTQAVDASLDVVGGLAPGVVDSVEQPLRDLASNQRATGLLTLGAAGALWAASGYVGALARALNAVYEVEEGRPFWKLRPLQLGLTLLGLVVTGAIGVLLLVTGPVAETIGDRIGLGSGVVTAWDIAKWPFVVAVVLVWLALLYFACPNVEHPRFRWLSLGSAVAVVVWAVGTAGFGLYVANFGSYDRTYGSLAGVVVFLVWLWLTNIAVLVGAEVNAETERAREQREGLDATELRLPPRDPAD